MKGIAYAAQHSDSVFATGSLDVVRYGRVLQVAAARRRARRGRRLRRPVLRHDGHPPAQARRVHAVVRARPQRPHLDPPGGADMTEIDTRATLSKFYGKYRGTCVNNIDPMQIGRIQVIVPDVAEVIPTSLGDAVPPGDRHPDTASSPSRRSAPGCGSSSSRATPTTRSGSAATGAGGRGAGDGARRAAGPVRHHLPDDAAERHHRSATRPGPTGGILIKTTTGRDDLGQRRRHHHQQRQGRDHHDDRPDGRHQRRRADGDLSAMPGPILHLGATVICAHAGTAHADDALPAGDGLGPAGRDARHAVRGRRLRA